MACNLKNILINGQSCEEEFSGAGTRVYLFMASDLAGIPQTTKGDKAEFRQDAFNSLIGKLYGIDIKEYSAQITSTANPNAGGFSNVLAFTVAKNMSQFSYVLRTLHNMKVGALVSDGKGGYYVIFSVFGSTTLENSGDSGTTPDSDHGHNTTITANPMIYPMQRFVPVTGATVKITSGVTLYKKVGTGSATEVTEGDAYDRSAEYFTDENGTVPAVFERDFETEGGEPLDLNEWLKQDE